MSDRLLAHSLSKAERLCSLKRIDALFAGGNKSMSAFPLRAVYMMVDRAEGEMPVQMLVSVSKRHFKHAVDRNHCKRLVREAYRHHKHLLWDALSGDKAIMVAFLWTSRERVPYGIVEQRMVNLLHRMVENL